MNLPKMRLLKVDVEGMELDVIKGAVKTIKSRPFPPAHSLSCGAARSPCLVATSSYQVKCLLVYSKPHPMLVPVSRSRRGSRRALRRCVRPQSVQAGALRQSALQPGGQHALCQDPGHGTLHPGEQRLGWRSGARRAVGEAFVVSGLLAPT